MELGHESLLAGNYEVADFHFSAVLGEDPRNQGAWLCKAVAMALKPGGNRREAASFLRASEPTTEEAVDYLSKLAKGNPELTEFFFRWQDDLSTEAPAFSKILYQAAMRTIADDAASYDAAALTAMADKTWTEGNADRAVLYMKRALQFDPNSRSRNLWLLEVATKELDEEREGRSTANAD